ncbi:hypothetical protein SLA2020_276800 [Shorea laevis]
MSSYLSEVLIAPLIDCSDIQKNISNSEIQHQCAHAVSNRNKTCIRATETGLFHIVVTKPRLVSFSLQPMSCVSPKPFPKVTHHYPRVIMFNINFPPNLSL